MESIGHKVRNHWLSTGVAIRPGATPEEISAFESRYGVRLPRDLRDYFSVVNGMDEGEMDGYMFSLWPLQEVKTIPEQFARYEGVEIPEDLRSYFLFADYFLHSHAYAIRLSAEPSDENSVIWFLLGDDDSSAVIADSFSDFMERYVADPDEVLFPPDYPTSGS